MHANLKIAKKNMAVIIDTFFLRESAIICTNV